MAQTVGRDTGSLAGSWAGHPRPPAPAVMCMMLVSVTVPPDLLVDRGTPSLLHSTETVEDGGGLTLQGSTTVWPTKASTLDGSSLSMVTPPTVRLKTGRVRGQEEEGRMGRLKKVQQSLYALLLELGISCHQGKHKERPQPGEVGGRQRQKEPTRQRHLYPPSHKSILPNKKRGDTQKARGETRQDCRHTQRQKGTFISVIYRHKAQSGGSS